MILDRFLRRESKQGKFFIVDGAIDEITEDIDIGSKALIRKLEKVQKDIRESDAVIVLEVEDDAGP